MTRVVNLRKQPYDVYIGRAGHGQSGYFGNPYPKGSICDHCGQTHLRSGDTIPCFHAYFLERVQTDSRFREAILGLKGKILGCFCKPQPCHGDVIVAWLEPEELSLP